MEINQELLINRRLSCTIIFQKLNIIFTLLSLLIYYSTKLLPTGLITNEAGEILLRDV